MRTNLIYQIHKARWWMLDPLSASAALGMYHDMIGAATLKSKYPMMEYEESDEEMLPETYYHYYMSHKGCDAIPKGKLINVVRLEGVMMRDGGMCQPGTREIASWLTQGERDSRVIGSILLTDSGGGSADSVRDLADAIKQCDKPVVAYCDGYMCSAAYYAASYCNAIMAHDKRNMIGCIGTMIELSGYPMKSTDEDGYTRVRIYADGSEEKNLDYEKALQGDVKPIRENLLNPLAEDFRSDVKTNRPTAADDQLKGRTYFAQDVVGTLIDGIGSITDAARKTIELSNLKITNMQGFEALQQLSTCHDLEMVDGYVTLNGEQLSEIDSMLSNANTEQALNEANAQTVQEQLEQINQLTAERDQLRESNEALTTENETLRTQLAESFHDTDENHQAPHNGNPAPEDANDPYAGMSIKEIYAKHEEMFH